MKYEITKGSENDFEGSPDGCVKVFRGTDCNVYVWGNGEWENEKVKGCAKGKGSAFKQYDWLSLIAERRPITEPVWDGEGLPPVGIMCEISNHGQEFYPTKIVAITEEYLITKSAAEQHYCLKNILFRPIRSPEDVARDEAIESMAEIIEYRTGCSPKPLARWLYEAGYRKME